MQTKILNALKDDFKDVINETSKILNSDGIVAIPTETVYGLAASAYSDTAIKKVFIAKGRPQDNPLIVHISNLDMLKEVVEYMPESAVKCAERFWPGPFTMVLPKSQKIAKSVSAGLSTVAVRMPNEPIALDIINASGLPLAAPSANLSGSPSPTTANHVIADLNGKIDAIVIGNDCKVGVESTVVAFTENGAKILRPGAVTLEDLSEIIPNVTVDKAVLQKPKDDEKVASPGMKYKHYAPKSDAYLVEGTAEQFISFVNEKENCAAICFDNEEKHIKVKALPYGDKDREETLAKNLFAILREIDNYNFDKVYIHAPSKKGIGLAVYNRLIRAVGFRVIKL